jgi:hypothetical protein
MTVYRSGAAIPAAAGRVGHAMRELPDSGAVMRMTRGRIWIGVLGTLLGGIVALNVVSLGLTASSGQIGVQIDQLERDNSALRAGIAEKLSATRVQSAAPALGLSVPPPSDITYLGYKPADLLRASKVLAGEISAAAEPWTPASQAAADTAPSQTYAPAAGTTAPSQAPTVTASPEPATSASSSPPPSSSGAAGTSAPAGGGVDAGL